MPEQIDPTIKALASAIGQAETGPSSPAAYTQKGASGEFGRYQFMPATYKNYAQKYLGDAAAQPTVENQNKIAYSFVADKKAAGFNPAQIASMWNAGEGKPDAYKENYKGTNAQGVEYDTPAYVQKVSQYYQQSKGGVMPVQDSSAPSDTPQAPSIGGFVGNVVQSGANFLGNTADALLHPIDTIQNIGGTAVGALQELGGQTNDNTAKFDNLKNYFVQKYGGLDNIEHSLYTDPIGVAADVSAALGIGGGLLGVVSKGAKLAGVADTANVAGRTGEALGVASHLTNPLTLPLKGAGALLSSGGGVLKNIGSQFTEISPKGMQDIIDHPQDYSPSAISKTSRIAVAKQVEEALQSKIAEKAETGSGYAPYKETPTAIKVAPDALDTIIRTAAKVDIADGVIKPSSTSAVRTTAELSKLQGVYNLYKPDFLKGTMTSEKFLNLRTDLSDIAYNESGIKNTKLASVGENIRNTLNEEYRTQIPGLKEKDLDYSTQTEELKTLRKGFIDKEGNLTDAAISKIANAGNKYDALSRLEQIVPGITRKLEILKTIDEIEKASGIKVGAYTKSIAEGGSIVAGLSTGNIPMIAGAITLSILTSPKIAVPLLRLYGFNKALVSNVTANLAKAATIGAVSNQVSSQISTQGGQVLPNIPTTPQDAYPSKDSNSTSVVPSSDLNALASSKNFDLKAALAAGHSPQEIEKFLKEN